MITASGLTKQFGKKVLFQGASFQLHPGKKYGLVGANGAGKSTFFSILLGEIEADHGHLSYPPALSLSTLKQDHYQYEKTPIIDLVLQGNPELWESWQERDSLLQKASFSEEDCLHLDQIDAFIEKNSGFSAKSEAEKILTGLGIPPHQFEMPTKVLSGGYKVRALLAKTLFSAPDYLLLDEPTNHLDLFSIRWLENYLKQYPGSVILISHDRHFLNSVCTDILDIDHETIRSYKGNYNAFEKQKTEAAFFIETALASQEKKKKQIVNFVDKFRSKPSKARQAMSRKRWIEKIEEEEEKLTLAPSSRKDFHLHFPQGKGSSAIALTTDGVEKSYGERKILSKVSFEVLRGEKVAFLGPNGVGKSTLLKILVGEVKKDLGLAKWGSGVRLGYFPQNVAEEVKGDSSLLNWLRLVDPSIPEQKVRNILGKVLFSGDDVEKKVDVLSGGEKARLLVAKLMLQERNVLIFDEPTNHFDIEAIESLTKALQNYEGTLLLVSHNQYFLEKLSPRIIELLPDGIRDKKETFSELIFAEPVKEESKKSSQAFEERKTLKRMEEKRKREIKKLEDLTEKLEQKMKGLDLKMAESSFFEQKTPEEIEQAVREKKELEAKLEKALATWEQFFA